MFKRYHDFHRVIPSTISVNQTDSGIAISVPRANEQVPLKYRRSLKCGLINLLLRIGNKEKAGELGRTETGMLYHNIPNKLVLLGVRKAV